MSRGAAQRVLERVTFAMAIVACGEGRLDLTIPADVQTVVVAGTPEPRLWERGDSALRLEDGPLELAYYTQRAEALELTRDAKGRLVTSSDPDGVVLPPTAHGARRTGEGFEPSDGATAALAALRVPRAPCPTPTVTRKRALDISGYGAARTGRFAVIGEVMLATVLSDVDPQRLFRFDADGWREIALPGPQGARQTDVLADRDSFLVVDRLGDTLTLFRVSLAGAVEVVHTLAPVTFTPYTNAFFPGSRRIYSMEIEGTELWSLDVASGELRVVAAPRGLGPACPDDDGVIDMLGPDVGTVVFAGNLPMRFDERAVSPNLEDARPGSFCKAGYAPLETGAEAITYRAPAIAAGAGELRLLWRVDDASPWVDVPSPDIYEDIVEVGGAIFAQTRGLGQLVRLHHAPQRAELPPRACAVPSVVNSSGVRADGEGGAVSLVEERQDRVTSSAQLIYFR